MNFIQNCTVGPKNVTKQIQLWTERIAHLAVLWSKTTQTAGGVAGIWEDPLACKMRTFILMFLIVFRNVLRNLFQYNTVGVSSDSRPKNC